MLENERNLLRRLNRILFKERGSQIRRQPPGPLRKSMGVYYEVQLSTGRVIARRVSLQDRASALVAEEDYGRKRWRRRQAATARDAHATAEWVTRWLDSRAADLTTQQVAVLQQVIRHARDAAS